MQTVNGYDHYRMKISPETTEKLQAVARQNQLTLNTIMQGAWALLLNCYSGEDDVLFGTIVSGRPADLAGIESMIGLFINTLPVRVRVQADNRLLPWLSRLQGQQLEMRQYEYSPLTRVQSWSEVPRGVPLFQSILAFENYPANLARQEKTGKLEASRERSIESTNFPITVMVVPGTQLSLLFVYDCACFRPETINRIAGHFQAVLEKIADEPESRLLDLLLFLEEHEGPADFQDSLHLLHENDQFVM
jgi:non-ribosomal peptide synthetase component F